MVTQKIILNWLKNETSPRLNIPGVSGFFVARLKNGEGSFRLHYRRNGRQATHVIGKFPSMPLPVAKKAAQELYVRVRSGEDIREELEHQRKKQQKTVGRYLNEVYSKKLSRKKSGEEIKNNINNHFGNLLRKSLSELTCADINSWQSKMEDKGLRFSTLIKVYGGFKAMINDAVKVGWIDANPLQYCHLEKGVDSILSKSSTIVDGRIYLTSEQSNRLLTALGLYDQFIIEQRERSIKHGKKYLPGLKELHYPDRAHLSILILYYNGFRVGDVITLDWKEVRLDRKLFVFTPNKIAHKKPEPQSFPMNDIVYQAVSKWWTQNGKPVTGPVFPNPKTGKSFNKTSFRNIWPKILELAELPSNLHLQTLRHNFASQLIMKGQDIYTVAELMATSVKMIEGYYGHLKPDHKFDAINKMLD